MNEILTFETLTSKINIHASMETKLARFGFLKSISSLLLRPPLPPSNKIVLTYAIRLLDDTFEFN